MLNQLKKDIYNLVIQMILLCVLICLGFTIQWDWVNIVGVVFMSLSVICCIIIPIDRINTAIKVAKFHKEFNEDMKALIKSKLKIRDVERKND